MGTLRLLYALALVLSLQLAASRPAEGGMMQKPGIQIGDTLQAPLEAQPPEKEAPQTSEGLPGPRQPSWDPTEGQGCQLRSLAVRVSDLGLGYNSEESVLFNYCSGSCPRGLTNHDMVIGLLRRNSVIPAVGEPCCRPTFYEDVAFMDNNYQFHRVMQVSAASCSCMG